MPKEWILAITVSQIGEKFSLGGSRPSARAAMSEMDASTGSIVIDPLRSISRARSWLSTWLASAVMTSNWTASPAGYRAAPGRTTRLTTPALSSSASISPGVM